MAWRRTVGAGAPGQGIGAGDRGLCWWGWGRRRDVVWLPPAVRPAGLPGGYPATAHDPALSVRCGQGPAQAGCRHCGEHERDAYRCPGPDQAPSAARECITCASPP